MPKKCYDVVEGICPKQKGGVIMPRFDRTGPNGSGPLTGRGQGDCVGARPTRFARFGRGAGRGLGRNNRRVGYEYSAPTLTEEKAYLENRLKEINEQIKE